MDLEFIYGQIQKSTKAIGKMENSMAKVDLQILKENQE